MSLKLLGLLFLLLPHLLMAQNEAKIDEILKSYAGENPGCAIAVVKNGKVMFSKTYGLANLEENIKVTSETNFRLASVTKQFTAVAILQLVEKGKLSLQTKLSECFPTLPAYARKINVKQLLNHTSGILDYDEEIDESGLKEQLSDADVLKSCMAFQSTYFEPGTAYRYSNTAYVLLGLIIEKYSGNSYSEYLKEHIFKPLKMNHTVAYLKGVNKVDNRAYGYALKEKKWTRKDQSSTSATLGDGGIYSNMKDLLKWDAALNRSQLLTPQSWNLAFAPQRLNDGAAINYGFGWHLKKSLKNTPVVYHTGSTASFRNIIYRIPDEELTIVILSNRNRPEETDMVQLAEQILLSMQ